MPEFPLRATLAAVLLSFATASFADVSTISRVDHANGRFVSTGGGQWEERNVAGQVGFRFAETGRDATTIHLYDASRGVSIDLDIPGKWIRYRAGSDPFVNLYAITGTASSGGAAGTDVARVNRVLHAEGEMSSDGTGSWREFGPDGRVAFILEETRRDATTIYLIDRSRGVELDLDLAGKRILYRDQGGADFPLYAITGADASYGNSERFRAGAAQAPPPSAPPRSSPAPGPEPAGPGGTVELKITNNTARAIEIYTYEDEAHVSLGDNIGRQSLSRVSVTTGQQVHVFYEGEDDLLACHDVTGTAQQVFTVTPAGPMCGEGLAEAPAEEEKPRQWRPQILSWLRAEQPRQGSLKPREVSEDSFGERNKYNSQSTRILNLEHFSRGYNVLKMNPANLTDKGTQTSARIFEELGTNDFNYHLAALGLNAPNYLEIYPAPFSEAIDIERTSFSDSSQTKSSGYTVGLGASAGPKQGGQGGRNKGGGGGEGKIGSSRSETNISKRQRMLIRKEAFIAKYWAVHVKDSLRLSNEIKRVLANPNGLRSQADFKNFFERFGTHYPLATLMGGWARRDTTYSMSEVGQTISKTLSVSASANVPVKAMNVKGSFSYEQSSTNQTGRGESSRESKTYNSVSSQTDSFGLTLGSAGGDDNYAPVAVELRPIWELVWPELLGTWRNAPVEGDKYREVYDEITDAREITRIDQLRARMRTALDAYLADKREISVDNEQWKPRVFQAYIESVTVKEGNDGAGDNDFYGTIQILGGGTTTALWKAATEDNAVDIAEGSRFGLNGNSHTVVAVPTPLAKRGPSGETYYVPDWSSALAGTIIFQALLVESEDGGDVPYPPMIHVVPLSEVANSKNRGSYRKVHTIKNDEATLEVVMEAFERDYRIRDNEESPRIPNFGQLGLTGPVTFDGGGMPR